MALGELGEVDKMAMRRSVFGSLFPNLPNVRSIRLTARKLNFGGKEWAGPPTANASIIDSAYKRVNQ